MPAGIKKTVLAIAGSLMAVGLGATAAFGWFGTSSGTMGEDQTSTTASPTASPSTTTSASPTASPTESTEASPSPSSSPSMLPTPTPSASPTGITGQGMDRDDTNSGRHVGWSHAPAFGAKQDRDEQSSTSTQQTSGEDRNEDFD